MLVWQWKTRRFEAKSILVLCNELSRKLQSGHDNQSKSWHMERTNKNAEFYQVVVTYWSQTCGDGWHFNLYQTDMKISLIENGCPTSDFNDFILFAGQENDDKNFRSFILRKSYDKNSSVVLECIWQSPCFRCHIIHMMWMSQKKIILCLSTRSFNKYCQYREFKMLVTVVQCQTNLLSKGNRSKTYDFKLKKVIVQKFSYESSTVIE